MIGPHRTAFQPKLTKTPLDDNVDKIIISSQIKMKEFTNRKAEIDQDINLLIGKTGVLEEDINSLNAEIRNKEGTLALLEESFNKTQQDIVNYDNLVKENWKVSLSKEAERHEELNAINTLLNSIKYGTIQESSSLKFEVKKKCEELLRIKHENDILLDKLYRSNRDLYAYEISYQDSSVNRKTNAIKAENGQKMIQKMYELHHRKPNKI